MTLDPLIAVSLRVSSAALLGLAAWHKIADFPAFSVVLGKYLKHTSLDGHRSIEVIGAGVICVEIALLAACALPAARAIAGGAAAAVLLLYAAAMHLNLHRGNILLDCGCSWGAKRQPVTRALVLRNLCLAPLAALMALPVGPRSLAAIDVISITAACLVAALLYSTINALLAAADSAEEPR